LKQPKNRLRFQFGTNSGIDANGLASITAGKGVRQPVTDIDRKYVVTIDGDCLLVDILTQKGFMVWRDALEKG
jgi:hypothetical protein